MKFKRATSVLLIATLAFSALISSTALFTFPSDNIQVSDLGGQVLGTDSTFSWVVDPVQYANNTSYSTSANGGFRSPLVEVDSNGDIYVIGQLGGSVDFGGGLRTPTQIFTSTSYPLNIALVKYDSDGNYLWDRLYRAKGDLSDFEIGPNNQLYILAGPTVSGDGGIWTSSYDHYEGFSVVLDSNGNVIDDNYSNWSNFFTTRRYDIDVNSNGDYLVVGDQRSNFSPNSNMILKKYNASQVGDFIRYHRTSGSGISTNNGSLNTAQDSNSDTLSYAGAIDESGNIYGVGKFTGVDYDFGAGNVTPNDATDGDIFIVKYDQGNNLNWINRTIDLPNNASPPLFAEVYSSNLYIVGQHANTSGASQTLNFGNGNTVVVPPNQYSLYIMKYDLNGNLAWIRSSSVSNSFSISELEFDSNGNLIIPMLLSSASGGFYQFFGSPGVNISEQNFVLFEVDPNGNGLSMSARSITSSNYFYPFEKPAIRDNAIVMTSEFFSDTTLAPGVTVSKGVAARGYFTVKYDRPVPKDCYSCTVDLNDGDACEVSTTVLSTQSCPVGTSESEFGCATAAGGSCPFNKSCYSCTSQLSDGNACVATTTVPSTSSCPAGTSEFPTGCASAAGGSCPVSKNCYSCTADLNDGNTCSVSITVASTASCPAGTSEIPTGCAVEVGGSCPAPAPPAGSLSQWFSVTEGRAAINGGLSGVDIPTDSFNLFGLSGTAALTTNSISSGTSTISNDPSRISKVQQYMYNYVNEALIIPITSGQNTWHGHLLDRANSNNGNIQTTTITTISGNLSEIVNNGTSFVRNSGDSKTIWELDGSLTIESGTVCNTQGLIFITGDLTIRPDLTNLNAQSACMFVVRGDVIVEAGAAPSGGNNGYNIIEAHIITDGEFRTIN